MWVFHSFKKRIPVYRMTAITVSCHKHLQCHKKKDIDCERSLSHPDPQPPLPRLLCPMAFHNTRPIMTHVTPTARICPAQCLQPVQCNLSSSCSAPGWSIPQSPEPISLVRYKIYLNNNVLMDRSLMMSVPPRQTTMDDNAAKGQST